MHITVGWTWWRHKRAPCLVLPGVPLTLNPRLHVRSQSFATEQWQSVVNQVQSSQRWVEPNQDSVPNQCGNIRNISVPSLSAQAKFDRPRHPNPRVLARRDFYFRSARIVIVTHRSANEKESAGRLGSPGLPDLLFWRQISQIRLFKRQLASKNCLFFSQYFAFFGGSWHMLSDWCLLFLNILPTVLLGFFRQCLVYFLKRYLATHRRIMLSHIWQPIMPKVRVENVEDE